jgi:hypothetical protein
MERIGGHMNECIFNIFFAAKTNPKYFKDNSGYKRFLNWEIGNVWEGGTGINLNRPLRRSCLKIILSSWEKIFNK